MQQHMNCEILSSFLHRTCTNQKSIRFRAVHLATRLEEYLKRVILVISGSRINNGENCSHGAVEEFST